jgi:hypothetical protein
VVGVDKGLRSLTLRRRNRLATAALALTGLVCLGTASASAGEVGMQALLNDNGSGRLFIKNGTGGPWSWQACSPRLLSCAPFGHGREIGTAGAGPGTVFRASSSTGDAGLSPTWDGRVAELDPPSVSGLIRVDELVKPKLARWSGGWEGDFDQTQLSACATPTGKGCTSITDPKYVFGCKGGATVLEPQFAGDYLRVADHRYGAGTAFPAVATSSPYGHPIWRGGRTTAVAIVGQVGPPRSAEKATCDSPLLIETSISSSGTASVRCRLGCRATLIASRAGRKARVVRALPPQSATPMKLWVPRRELARIGAGRARLVVNVDGRRTAQRTIAFAMPANHVARSTRRGERTRSNR